jgi:hypothetical protein
MKLKNSLLIALASLVLALVVASAVTPSPRPKPTASAPASPTDTRSTAPKATPTPREVLPSPSDQPPAVASTPSNNNPPPKPILYLLRTEPYSANGKNWIRYRYDVANKAGYPADMFAAAPALPPCGANTNSSRTWVDFFDATGKRLYGFCALGKPADLGLLWFALEDGVIPPSYVYIELNDRQTNTKYKSNLADTTL